MTTANLRLVVGAVLAGLALSTTVGGQRPGEAARTLAPAAMARVGTVDERYQSYNVEMIEVTGGRFWRPYDAAPGGAAPASPAATQAPAGMDPNLYEYRPPLDLADPTLRRLALALAPAYVRVSGTWANTTYFAGPGESATTPPPGFMGVLTSAQWQGVVEFARAARADIVTSFAVGAGTRDATGAWTPDHARRWADHTASIGGRIAAAEFMNEPTVARMGGAPEGYDAAAYGRDVQRFRAFAREALPGMLIVGPGSVGESARGFGLAQGPRSPLALLPTRDLLAASGRGLDAFSYHHYGAVSRRCAALGPQLQMTPDRALSEEWLARTDDTLALYRGLRDEFEPGAPIWLTETAEAACGGNLWAGTFLDTFRYLDQLGRLARQGVQTVMHNTLVASDYSLLDERRGLEPKPSYWGALLWRRLMGTTVLDPGLASGDGLHVYAHCLRGVPGGVAVLAINLDTAAPRQVTAPAAVRYTLSAPSAELQDVRVRLNGRDLALTAGRELPGLEGARSAAGTLALPPASITFLEITGAGNNACR